MRPFILKDVEGFSDVDASLWTDPTAKYLAEGSEQKRGERLEKETFDRLEEDFPEFTFKRNSKHKRSRGVPDAAFISPVSKTEKYIEIKTVSLTPERQGKKEVTRIKIFDDEGNQNFDYLVILFIDPNQGVFARSMTHEECVKAIELKLMRYRESYRGAYGFPIDMAEWERTKQNINYGPLKMYKDFDCIKHHEQQIDKSKNMLDIDNKQVTIKDVISKPLTKEGQEMIGTKMRKPPYSEDISLEQYMSYDENPIQRKTGLRLSGAKKNHLKKFFR